MLDLLCTLNVGWGSVWQLNPVFKQIVVNPVDKLVDAFTASFVRPVASFLLCLVKNSFNDPIVLLDSIKLSPESEPSCSTQCSESLVNTNEK